LSLFSFFNDTDNLSLEVSLALINNKKKGRAEYAGQQSYNTQDSGKVLKPAGSFTELPLECSN